MGWDFSNRQLFASNADALQLRAAIIGELRRKLRADGLTETGVESEAHRHLVVGPPGRWIFMGDTAGSTEWADPAAFTDLSSKLSLLAPVVDIHVSDSAAIWFYLYRGGELVDKFGNAANGFFHFLFGFKTEEEALAFRGKPELWAEFLRDGACVEALRSGWAPAQGMSADELLDLSAGLFGWDPDLVRVGYTVFNEADEVKYTDCLESPVWEPGAFTELHFQSR